MRPQLDEVVAASRDPGKRPAAGITSTSVTGGQDLGDDVESLAPVRGAGDIADHPAPANAVDGRGEQRQLQSVQLLDFVRLPAPTCLWAPVAAPPEPVHGTYSQHSAE